MSPVLLPSKMISIALSLMQHRKSLYYHLHDSLQVHAHLSGAPDARRSPAAAIIAGSLAWAAVTLSANAADLSAGKLP